MLGNVYRDREGIKMNKRQKKKQIKKKAEKLADKLLEAFGIELGESRVKHYEQLIK